jgi:hypothetical protein
MKSKNESSISKGRELFADGIEFLADSTMDSGVLKDIPIVGWAAKIIAARNSINDNLYAAKINKFLLNLHDIPEEKIRQFRNSIQSNKDDTNRLCEKIILSLDAITDTSKADIISDLFIAYLDGVLSNSSFRRCVDVTCNVYIDDLMIFIKDMFLYETSLHELKRMKLYPLSILSTPLFDMGETLNEMTSKEPDDSNTESRISEFKENPKGSFHYSNSQLGNDFRKAYKHAKDLHKQTNINT